MKLIVIRPIAIHGNWFPAVHAGMTTYHYDSLRVKIKHRQLGYRIVYRVDDNIVSVTVIATGKRDKEKSYQDAGKRI